jgi:hypothetical protein
MDDCKMDFSAGRNQNTAKATKLAMRTKGKKARVFSDWRYKKGLPWSSCWVDMYVKTWI